ncbi:RcnB family protein [Novosphingobium sp. KCTC 2891]|uniref:RcnB family protein n=1 Tax=Novosphingobium sp. KCTC 2891 TaxID=2989730 RepID=UPI0022237B12|nr:RcnB family protein [Novosphingobium sp. KCTC 2891]MCW1383433.1 RcnB family protein [Novosphingobium sp. KCTC 2891]
MKKLTAAFLGLALALPAATPALARNDHPGNHGNDVRGAAHADVRPGSRNHGADVRVAAHANPFRQGQRFHSNRAPHYRVVEYRRYHRLSAPPRGYHWVRSGDDALLVSLRSGLVRSVVRGLF